MENLRYHIGSFLIVVLFVIIALSSKDIGTFLFGEEAWPEDLINCEWINPPQDVSTQIQILCINQEWEPIPGITINGQIVLYKNIEHPTINFTCVTSPQSVHKFTGVTNSSGQLNLSSPTYSKSSHNDHVVVLLTSVENDDYLSGKVVDRNVLDRSWPVEIHLKLTKKEDL